MDDIPKILVGVLDSSEIYWEEMGDYRCPICDLECEEARNGLEIFDLEKLKEYVLWSKFLDPFVVEGMTVEEIHDYLENDIIFAECIHDRLYGDWIRTDADGWIPDPDGDWAAIENHFEGTVQVLYSKLIKMCGLCSPCYPDQGDITTFGPYVTYTLPPDWIVKE